MKRIKQLIYKVTYLHFGKYIAEEKNFDNDSDFSDWMMKRKTTEVLGPTVRTVMLSDTGAVVNTPEYHERQMKLLGPEKGKK